MIPSSPVKAQFSADFPLETRAERGVTTTVAKTPGAVTPLLVSAADPLRKKITIKNVGAQVVYIGNAADMTAADGFPLAASGGVGSTYEDDGSKSAWYALAASTTGDIRVIETVRDD